MPAVLSSWAAGFAARKLIYVPLRAAPERKRVFVSYIFLAVHLHIGISEWQNESLLQRILLKRFKEPTKYIAF